MRVPEFILSEFMGQIDQSAYLFFCEHEVQVLPNQASSAFLEFRKLAVILYEWLDNEEFDLKPEYRKALDSKKMLLLLEETVSMLASDQIEILTADPHEDIPLFLKQVHASFSRITIKEDQAKAWNDYVNGADPDFQNISYTFEESSIQMCSFCDKTTEDVEDIIAGPKAKICNECIDLCNNVLAEDEYQHLNKAISCVAMIKKICLAGNKYNFKHNIVPMTI